MNNKYYTSFYPSPLGIIKIDFVIDGVININFVDNKEIVKGNLNGTYFKDPAVRKIYNLIYDQLNEYFTGKRKKFDLPIFLRGTEFQIKVWQSLIEIPYGETRSYSQIAKTIGKKGAARAVGLANSNNPLILIIPCHRVIGADGKLTGYNGGIWRKKWLLEHESKKKKG